MRLLVLLILLLGALLATPGRATAIAAAAKRAREQGRPILALVRKYGGLKVLDTTMLAPFMDEAIVELVRARFVAL
ncbi:MAG: hypothetical protein EXS13_08170 [Planctomycetes bacterium]|nr:hypothetical protein [Planctomycetota bacterium]